MFMFTALIVINIFCFHSTAFISRTIYRRDIKARGIAQWKRHHTEFIEFEDRMQTFLQKHESRVMQDRRNMRWLIFNNCCSNFSYIYAIYFVNLHAHVIANHSQYKTRVRIAQEITCDVNFNKRTLASKMSNIKEVLGN